jgi:hypothetical protein
MDSSFVKYAKSRHTDAYSLKSAFSGRRQITPRIHTALKKTMQFLFPQKIQPTEMYLQKSLQPF